MRILFIHPNTPDYLSAGIFHGLRTMFGKDCIDLPRFDCMYKPYFESLRKKIRGGGFTLYGLLPDLQELSVHRFFIWQKNILDFDCYVVADINNTWQQYFDLLQHGVDPASIIVLDGSDNSRLFPFNNWADVKTHFCYKLFKKINPGTLYAKREWIDDVVLNTGVNKILATLAFQHRLPFKIATVSFAIPEEKINYVAPENKTKTMVTHIVDPDWNDVQVEPFVSETDYYADLQKSRFGITMRRGGWDCLRHYEIAANGAIICFKNLPLKPDSCAPQGLNDTNCIVYQHKDELLERLEMMTEESYKDMQANSYHWIYDNTTVKAAKRLLTAWNQKHAIAFDETEKI